MILYLYIKGEAGQKGALGPKGIKGASGDAGIPGVPGTVGPAGRRVSKETTFFFQFLNNFLASNMSMF